MVTFIKILYYINTLVRLLEDLNIMYTKLIELVT